VDLAQEIAKLFASEPMVQFRCTPSATVLGKEVELHAMIVLRQGKLEYKLEPVVKCKTAPSLELILKEEEAPASMARKFSGRINTEKLGRGVYQFLLYPRRDQKPVAISTLRVYATTDLTEALPRD
jgi:hypothetical protein